MQGSTELHVHFKDGLEATMDFRFRPKTDWATEFNGKLNCTVNFRQSSVSQSV
jgi:hypothetical protein